MSKPLAVVTIDGPSGVGKSTISRQLAAKLGFTYLDTGAMYRAVALGCSQANIDVQDEDAVKALLPELNIQLSPRKRADEEIKVVLNGVDISNAIRTPEMGMLASQVSVLQPVRDRLTAMQQQMGEKGNIVAEGRDTGTVVFPSALWKFYLDASPEIRARRRAIQLREQGTKVNEQELLNQIKNRDKADSERAIAPLTKAQDAVYIDSTNITVDAVIDQMAAYINNLKQKITQL